MTYEISDAVAVEPTPLAEDLAVQGGGNWQDLPIRGGVGTLQQWIDSKLAVAQLLTHICPPFLALAAVSGAIGCFQACAITRRMDPVNLLPGSRPSQRRLRAWRRAQPRARFPRNQASRRECLDQAWPAETILDWLRATSFLKNLNDKDEAAKAWAIALTGRSRGHGVHHDSDKVSRGVIRQARVRLDITACLLFREFVKRINIPATYLFLYIDGSPLWRGWEFYAASIDFSSGEWRQRRLLPAVTLSRCQLDAVSKTFALLWQLWLSLGPSVADLRLWCNRVVTITSDAGTERLVSGMRDILPEFIWAIGGAIPRDMRISPANHFGDLYLMVVTIVTAVVGVMYSERPRF